VTAGLGRLLLPWLKLTEEPPALPIGSHEVLSVERAAPGYLMYLRLRWVLRLIPALVGVAIVLAVPKPGPWVLVEFFGLAMLLAGAALNFFVITLDYRLRWYVVTDRSLLIREGIWNQREITLTFANVQNVSVTQGPVERLFGISEVVVTTAGGATKTEAQQGTSVLGHEGRLRGLADAHRVRDTILALMRKHKGAGLGDDSAIHAAPMPSSAFSPAALTVLAEAAAEARLLRAAIG